MSIVHVSDAVTVPKVVVTLLRLDRGAKVKVIVEVLPSKLRATQDYRRSI